MLKDNPLPTSLEEAAVRTTYALPPVEVTEEHKETFFKAFLADKPYQEEFKLMGGNYRIVLSTVTMRQNADLLRQVAFDRDIGKIDGQNDYYFSRVTNYRLGQALVSINDKPFADDITEATYPVNKKDGTSYVSARADLLSEWTMIKLAAVQAALVEFDQRVLVLVDAVNKADFWKAAA